jgi:hypothetical protein
MKPRNRDYIIRWNWRNDEEGSPMKVDHITATTAPRAFTKLMKMLSHANAGANQHVVIVHEIVINE